MTKLSMAQVDKSYDVVVTDGDLDYGEEVDWNTEGVDEAIYRTSLQRKEIRTKRQREDGELVGKGAIRKHRKY